MLTRRHIREKVLKSLYAFFQSENTELAAGEKELMHSIDKVYEIYLYYLALLPELRFFAQNYVEERKNKRLPTAEDLNPSLNFVSNGIIDVIASHRPLNEQCEKLKINWNRDHELIKRLYYSFKDSEVFRTYEMLNAPGLDDDREILYVLYEQFLFPSEDIRQLFEERSIYWLDDIELMQAGVLKTIKSVKPGEEVLMKLQPLHKERDEDREFARALFRKTIAKSDAYQKEIASRTQNWEIDRIAKMDVILMKMAMCELTEFSSIPVKVTLDEYIELSKDYSSPQSKTFINGILDKIVIDFKKDNKIQKAGRGLVE
jgi:N utilization substance protein B